MLFGKAGGGAGDQKQNPALMVVLVVVILAAGVFAYRSMSGSGGVSTPPEQPPSTADGSSIPMGPPGMRPPPGGGPHGAPPGAVSPALPSSAPPRPGAAHSPAVVPSARPPARRVPAQPAARPPAQPAAKPAPRVEMRQIKVFNTVSVSYPANWKISAGGGNAAAVFTDGKAFFEVRAPDPNATSAKAIAQSALKSVARGAKPTGEGAERIAGHDTYWIAVTVGGQTARIVGVDAPTRVVLFEHVKGAQFSSYRELFNKMQAGMSFGG